MLTPLIAITSAKNAPIWNDDQRWAGAAEDRPTIAVPTDAADRLGLGMEFAALEFWRGVRERVEHDEFPTRTRTE
jgi:hypothetical protein